MRWCVVRALRPRVSGLAGNLLQSAQSVDDLFAVLQELPIHRFRRFAEIEWPRDRCPSTVERSHLVSRRSYLESGAGGLCPVVRVGSDWLHADLLTFLPSHVLSPQPPWALCLRGESVRFASCGMRRM